MTIPRVKGYTPEKAQEESDSALLINPAVAGISGMNPALKDALSNALHQQADTVPAFKLSLVDATEFNNVEDFMRANNMNTDNPARNKDVDEFMFRALRCYMTLHKKLKTEDDNSFDMFDCSIRRKFSHLMQEESGLYDIDFSTTFDMLHGFADQIDPIVL
ncbi:hypothetical protein J8273_6810 [Carpediemonas membranifera]|uniref:Uncharacterized protein n=1 Tax=Carpediemonas membranifera TaxID=201153 RepID=A0A8J6B338_9EUKA|nr:hypothetical protein J8273_6810 [Carpediemonas membranifera]|eukprot:KAG9391919.1 hypothetical protein J8273_6810 [Carpediemonas membranifera]